MGIDVRVVIGGLAALAFTSGDASAGPKKLKAEFLCGTYADGKILTVLKGGKVGKITDTVACAFHLTDPDEPGHSVHLRTLHNGTEIKVVDGTANVEGESKDFEVYLKPGEAFKSCEDFDIQVGIYDPGGQYSQTIKVQQSCPKPPPLKAELTCMTEYGDGTQVKFPATKKLKGRLEKSLDCMIYAKSPGDAKLTGSVWVKGKTPHKDLMAEVPGGGGKVDATLDPDADFQVCSTKFTVQASLVDDSGAERWTGKLDIPAQFCPD